MSLPTSDLFRSFTTHIVIEMNPLQTNVYGTQNNVSVSPFSVRMMSIHCVLYPNGCFRFYRKSYWECMLGSEQNHNVMWTALAKQGTSRQQHPTDLRFNTHQQCRLLWSVIINQINTFNLSRTCYWKKFISDSVIHYAYCVNQNLPFRV